MKRLFSIAAIWALSCTPVHAQDGDDGLSLMERGAQMFLEGIMREIDPALNDLQGMVEEMEPALRGFLRDMGPAVAELLGEIEDLSKYHPPEILPNGDIILRKKTPQEMQEQGPEGEIEI